MILTIMLTIVLKNSYTRLFATLSISMVLISLLPRHSSVESVIAQAMLLIVMVLTTWGVLYIKRLYARLRNEKQQMNVLLGQRKESQEELIIQKEQLEKVTSDIKRLNASLENKVEERTLILKSALKEVERSQEELSDAFNKEKELNDIKSRFVSMASHEFRTPLSTIFSSVALIGKYTLTEEQDKRNKHLWRIRDSVQHLNGLLEDFLNLGRLEEGKIKAEPVVFDAREHILDVCEEMRGMEKPGQQIQFTFNGEHSFITDKRLLKNILINLLSNAIKFSDPGKSIYIDITHKENQLFINVKDEGVGVPEEDMQHLFSTFFRGKNVTNVQGTGLGLNIVRRYVQLLNGTITVTSEINKGTIFHLSLPLLSQSVSV
jgi:signal transduction histidine kinase